MKLENSMPRIIFIDEEIKSYFCEWLKCDESDVDEKLGILLKQIGVSNNEFCTLSKKRIINDAFLVDCYFNMARENSLLSITELQDNQGILKIGYKRYSKSFDYALEFNESEPVFKVQAISIMNKQTGLKYSYNYGDTEYKSSINDYYNTGFITIKYPESLKKRNNIPFIDIDKIDNKLIYSDLKLHLKDIYSLVKESSFEDISVYPMVSIKIRSNTNANNASSTTFEYGDISEIIRTKGDETITINGENNWTYQSDGLTISKDNNSIEYKLIIGPGQININAMPTEQIANAGLIVNDIKSLVKNIK